jgi:hypothetical protein
MSLMLHSGANGVSYRRPTRRSRPCSDRHSHSVAHHEIVELVRYTLGFYASEPVGLADVGISSNVRFAQIAVIPSIWLITPPLPASISFARAE